MYMSTPETSTLSLHDALPISFARLDADAGFHDHEGHLVISRLSVRFLCPRYPQDADVRGLPFEGKWIPGQINVIDRKSTRLNSSHSSISYAVFCLKKKYVHFD